MTYNEAIQFLFNSLPQFQRIGSAAYKADLERTLALDKYFGEPHKKFITIHVAGTNGKGSVSHSLASILQSAGYKTGLYTSPHLIDFRERIKINGEMISEAEVLRFVELHSDIINEVKPSFFEMTVAMCFDFFERQHVDIAVIETGLGGRLDSTNIITPILSVITNISIEHTEFLGDTLEKIATEKAGIIKYSVPVVVGESLPETNKVFAETAQRMKSPIYFADAAFHPTFSTMIFDENRKKYYRQFNYEYADNKQIKLIADLTGNYQQKNMLTVYKAVEILKNECKIEISDENFENGLKNVVANTGLQGRWQTLNFNPLVIADTGHNEAGISQVMEQIWQTAFKKLHIVFGVVKEKNLKKILTLLPADNSVSYYFTRASVERSLDAQLLAQEAKQYGIEGRVLATPTEAYKMALQRAEANDLIFIGGSTFVVADVLADLQKLK